MRLFESKIISRAYLWAIASLVRVFVASLVLSVLFVVAALVLPPLLFGAAALVLLFGLGAAAARIRYSSSALDYPGVDTFFQQVPCYLSIQDRNLRIRRTNRLFRRDFGENRVGEKCYKVYKGAEEVCPNCPVVKTFADGETHTTEETVITKDGKPAQMIVYTTPVKDERGKIVGVMEMSTNITEVKKLQNEIEASRKEYQELFENVPCYLSIQDRQLKIIRANRLFKEHFGEYEGKYCYEIFKRRDTPCPECHAEMTLRDGKTRSKETTVITRSGSTARLVTYTSPIFDKRGNITAVMEMSTDITEIERLQRELTYMGRTIAVMAHRIKNILMGLEGGIFVVNTGMEDGDENLVKQGWGMIQRNVENVSRIVKDLLYCSREREMNFEMIDPAPVIRSVWELFIGRAKKEGIALKLELPETLPVGRFDREALHSMMTNLVTNAFDACLSDATEGKEEHYIIIRGWCDDEGKYVFEVEDNGPGIPGQVGETVFEDFFTTKGREGTGLGLLVAQKVIEEHHGTITFRSTEGKGTTFRATFPSGESGGVNRHVSGDNH